VRKEYHRGGVLVKMNVRGKP